MVDSPAGQLASQGWTRLPWRVESGVTDAVVAALAPAVDAGVRRMENYWVACGPVRDLALHPRVVAFVEALLGAPSIPFQTLDFAHATQQPLHADSAHFDTLPSGRMLGVWVALEDIGADQGPLRVVPGSHRWADRLVPLSGIANAEYESVVRAATKGSDVVDLPVRRGEVVVWHPHLLHGGAPLGEHGSSRWSQVTHYFASGVGYVVPAESRRDLGEYRLRPVVDIRSWRPVPQIGGLRRTGLRRVGDASAVADAGGPGLRTRVGNRWWGAVSAATGTAALVRHRATVRRALAGRAPSATAG